MSDKKTLSLDVDNRVVSVRLPSDNYSVSYGIREVDVPLDFEVGVGDTYTEPAQAEAVAEPKAAKGKKAE